MSFVIPWTCEWSDSEVIGRVLGGDTPAYELLIRRYNQRLYRLVRSILREDDEAEDVMQESYVRAYEHLREFEGRSSFFTWLGRIAVHEALARIRKGERIEYSDFDDEDTSIPFASSSAMNPEQQTASIETKALLERAIVALPDKYRSVLMMRDVEEMSTAETADTLGLSEEAVKVRLHRARALLRKELYLRFGATTVLAFQFPATRCDRVVAGVFARISALQDESA